MRAAILLALAALGLWGLSLLASTTSAGTGYRYYGTHVGKPAHVCVSLNDAAGVSGSHVAVWLGASTPTDSAWVQGGVAYENGAAVLIYIEFKRPGLYPEFVGWSASLGERVCVRVEDHSARWRVLVGGHLSRSILMLKPTLISTLEIYGDAKGSGTIGTRGVNS